MRGRLEDDKDFECLSVTGMLFFFVLFSIISSLRYNFIRHHGFIVALIIPTDLLS